MNRPPSAPDHQIERPLIAHVVHRFDTGGMENGVVNLINRMPVDFADHCVIALTSVAPEFAARVTRADVRMIALERPPGQTARIFPKLYQTLKSLRPTIVHTRNAATLEAQVPAWLARIPVRIHGEHGWDVNDVGGTNTRLLMLRRVLRRFVHHQIALSRPTEHYLLERVGVPRAAVTEITNGVDTDRFVPACSVAEARALLDGCPIPPEAFVVGHVGRMAAVKNVPLLVRAFAALRDRDPRFAHEAWLAFIGDGPELREIQALVQRLGVADRTWFAGARSDIPACLRSFDLLSLVSIVEGVSNAILEGMASGLAVVATRVGGNDELVADGATGVLVPSGDDAAVAAALGRYFVDRTLLRAHAASARQRACERFSIDTMVARYQTVYANSLRMAGIATQASRIAGVDPHLPSVDGQGFPGPARRALR